MRGKNMENKKLAEYFGIFIGIAITLWLIIFSKSFVRASVEAQRKFWGPLIGRIFGERAVEFLWGPQSIRIGEYILPIAGILFLLFIFGMIIYKEILKR